MVDTESSASTGSAVTGARAGDLMQLLLDSTPRTRAELAVLTGLARSTIAMRVDSLMASGFISAFDVPVLVDKDVNIMTLGEQHTQ